jgi:NAD(P)-dependent dehydrogenase (short-subunit alcohol dehydrogenase family)
MRRHTVIITGATRGLGRATAVAFAQSGHQVVGLYSSDEVAADELRGTLQALESDSFVLKHDVSQPGSLLWNRPEITEAGSLVLINNACAPFTPQPLHHLGWDEFERNLIVNLKGSLLCSQSVLRPMIRKARGTIVNVLTLALTGLPPKGFAAYIAAKHALHGLTLALAAEYSTKGVRVFSVSPGYMSTTLTSGWDTRLAAAVRSASLHSDPPQSAQRIVELVSSATTAGAGEDYPI